MLRKIISGGQTGADQAGLRAARRLGLETGGWAPHGWQTQDGPAPWLAEYGLVEYLGGYAARTAVNVFNSDATVRFALNFGSSGEICTMRAIDKYKKPWFDILSTTLHQVGQPAFEQFLIKYNVRVLNVAGNSEKTAPGIGARVEQFLVAALCTPRAETT